MLLKYTTVHSRGRDPLLGVFGEFYFGQIVDAPFLKTKLRKSGHTIHFMAGGRRVTCFTKTLKTSACAGGGTKAPQAAQQYAGDVFVGSNKVHSAMSDTRERLGTETNAEPTNS